MDATGDFACLVFVFWPLNDVSLRLYLNTYYASDSVTCIIRPHSLIMQLKQQSTTVGGIRKTSSCPVPNMSSPRVDYSASCLVHELTSPQDVQSTSWQSASWRIRELSSYHNTNPNPDPNPTKRLTLLTVLNPTISWRTLSMGNGKLCGVKVQVYSRAQIMSCSVQLSYHYGYMRGITIHRTALDYQWRTCFFFRRNNCYLLLYNEHLLTVFAYNYNT